jgi:hypothetical protein
LVDKASFRRLLTYCRPSLHDSDIPHRTKLQKYILDRAAMVEQRVRDKLEVYGTLPHDLHQFHDAYYSLRMYLDKFLSPLIRGPLELGIHTFLLLDTTYLPPKTGLKIGNSSPSSWRLPLSKVITQVPIWQMSLCALLIVMAYVKR